MGGVGLRVVGDVVDVVVSAVHTVASSSGSVLAITASVCSGEVHLCGGLCHRARDVLPSDLREVGRGPSCHGAGVGARGGVDVRDEFAEQSVRSAAPAAVGFDAKSPEDEHELLCHGAVFGEFSLFLGGDADAHYWVEMFVRLVAGVCDHTVRECRHTAADVEVVDR